MSLDSYLMNSFEVFDHTIETSYQERIVTFAYLSVEMQTAFLNRGYAPAITIDTSESVVFSVLAWPLAWKQTNPKMYRLTRNIYKEGTPGFNDSRCRQGYYIQADSAKEALIKMAEQFPGETFTIQLWQD